MIGEQRISIPASEGTLGEALRWARGQRRMTMRGLAVALGVSAPFLSDVEHDRRTLTDDRLLQAAEVLNVDPVELDVRRGYSRDLADWIARDPDLVRLLREARRTGHRLVMGPSQTIHEELL